MSVFAKMLAEKVQSYIELRRSLGYAFKKQAATFRAFVRFVEVGAVRRSAHESYGARLRPFVHRRSQRPSHSSWSATPLLRVSRRLRRKNRGT